MKSQRKTKLWIPAGILAAAAAVLLFLLPSKLSSASAAVTSNSGAVYVGQAAIAPDDGNWYDDGIQTTTAPIITVLTHGLGGQAADWSNNYNGTPQSGATFAYDPTSLIEQLRTKAINEGHGANVYWARMEPPITGIATEFRLIYLQQHVNAVYTDITHTTTHLEIEDLFRHTIIVFQANSPTASNAAVYAEFRAMLNRIVLDVKALSGIYPKINLIGHSRGGLTNMQYAQDYPALVANLFSVGTPYRGSHFGKINLFAPDNDGFRSIQRVDLQNIMRDTWNTNRSTRYSHIDFYPMAGFSDVSFLQEVAYNYDGDWSLYGGQAVMKLLTDELAEYGNNEWYTIKAPLISGAINLAELAKGLPATGYDTVRDIFDEALVREDNVGGWILRVIAANFTKGNVVLYDDMLVGYESQLADGYNGITDRFVKCWTAPDARNAAVMQKVSMDDIPVVHNLEARDTYFIGKIITNIETGSLDIYNTSELGGFIILKSVKGGVKLSGTATIPAHFNGLPVRVIESSAFANQYTLTALTVPNSVSDFGNQAFHTNLTVRWLGKYAFRGSTFVEYLGGQSSFYLPEEIAGRSITSVGADAFANQTQLTQITLPAGINTIGSRAFQNCSNLSAVNLSAASLMSIGSYAFDTCAIRSLSLPNTLRQISEGAFIRAFSASGTLSSIVLPSQLTSIEAYAFAENPQLTHITISAGVATIGNYAFSGATGLTSIRNNSIVPQTINSTTFSGVTRSNVTVTVPADTKQAYTSAGWSSFKFAEDSYILNLNYGTGSTTMLVGYNKTISISGGTLAPKRSGYQFEGYYSEQNGQGVKYISAAWVGDSYQLQGMSKRWPYDRSGTLYAYWVTPRTAKVTFDRQGGSGGDDYVIATVGQPMPYMPPYLYSIPKLTGYGFLGYFTAPQGGYNPVQYYSSSMTSARNWDKASTDVTLYAHWEESNYTVYTRTYTDKYNSATNYKLVKFTAPMNLTPPSISNWTFLEWRAWPSTGGDHIFFSADKNLQKTVAQYYNEGFMFSGIIHIYAYYKYTPKECVASGTLITLADGSQKPVELLTGEETLLVWNMLTGGFDTAPILFVDSDAEAAYEIIHLYFSDGTEVKVISEHGFWDYDLNEYVFLRNDAEKYIGHYFNKQRTLPNGKLKSKRVKLVDVEIYEEVTTAWSPVTAGHLCYYVNGMLSMPGATTGLINIFEVNGKKMKADAEAMQADIEQYGLFTYEEFAGLFPIPEEMFEAFGGQYLKVSLGKGLLTLEQLGALIGQYAAFLGV